MGKILGKSALGFAGLAVISWSVQNLCDWIFFYPKEITAFSLFLRDVWQYVLWFLLLLAYLYLLFFLFRHERHCGLIIMLHGVFLIMQFFLLLLLTAKGILLLSHEMQKLSACIMNVFGLPVILAATMFISLKSAKSIKADYKNKSPNVLIIAAKSALCSFALIVVLHIYSKSPMYEKVFGYFGLFLESPYIVIPLLAIAYAFGLYRLFQRQTYRRTLLIMNAVFLIIVCGVMLLFTDEVRALVNISPLPITVYLCNTAIITIVLAFIFRSVEKHSRSIASVNPPQAQSLEASRQHRPAC